MKKITFAIGGTTFFANLIIGLLVSAYAPFNLLFTSTIIIVTTLLLYLVEQLKLKDGFTIGLYSLNLFMGFTELILGITSVDSLQDNGCVIAAIILIAIQVITLVVCWVTSKNI